jgi:soluble lytic murein transglycosylase-like protein
MRLALFFLACLPTLAGEYAVLTNGFRLHADSHRRDGDAILLESNGGAIRMPAGDIVRFEAEDAPPVVTAAPAPVPPPTPTPPPPDGRKLVTLAADAAALPRALVQSIAHAESAYRSDAVSSKGAVGLMQLMPGTAALLKVDRQDPAQNAWAGAVYLRSLLERYNGSVSRAVAAYNAGPGAVDKYHGVPPYSETRAYVRRVLAEYEKSTKTAR